MLSFLLVLELPVLLVDLSAPVAREMFDLLSPSFSSLQSCILMSNQVLFGKSTVAWLDGLWGDMMEESYPIASLQLRNNDGLLLGKGEGNLRQMSGQQVSTRRAPD